MNTQPVPTFPKLAKFPEFEGKPIDTIIQDLLDKVINDNFNPDDWQLPEFDYDPEFNQFRLDVYKMRPELNHLYSNDILDLFNYIDKNFVYNKSLSTEDRKKYYYLKLSI